MTDLFLNKYTVARPGAGGFKKKEITNGGSSLLIVETATCLGVAKHFIIYLSELQWLLHPAPRRDLCGRAGSADRINRRGVARWLRNGICARGVITTCNSAITDLTIKERTSLVYQVVTYP
jgi:hypothetical protein